MKRSSSPALSVLLAAAVMLGVCAAARWALAGALGEALAAFGAAALGSVAAALVLARARLSGGRDVAAELTAAAQAMRKGDLDARAPDLEDDALAPLGRALNDLASSVKASHAATQKELELLTGILDAMVEGVVVFDRDGHIVKANLAARRMAVSPDSVLGMSAIEAFRNAALAGAVERALRRGESGPMSADGGSREIELGGVLSRRLLVHTAARTDREGGGGVIVVLHDVTDLRRLETIRTEFVANVSHELRTPVTAITSAAETLLGGALDDRRDAAEFVEIIDRNARRLRNLVEDLLDLSKIEGKAYPVRCAEVELLPVFSHARTLAEGAAAKRKVQIVVDVAGGVAAWIDRRAFEQVVGNLLDNAVKYAGEGATVTLGAAEEGDHVAVKVADTGAGIAPHHLERLFERFYRVDAGRSREMGGTGLGLAIVKHLVESMRGEIAVESELGQGTTFTIRLPRQPPSSPESDEEEGE